MSASTTPKQCGHVPHPNLRCTCFCAPVSATVRPSCLPVALASNEAPYNNVTAVAGISFASYHLPQHRHLPVFNVLRDYYCTIHSPRTPLHSPKRLARYASPGNTLSLPSRDPCSCPLQIPRHSFLSHPHTTPPTQSSHFFYYHSTLRDNQLTLAS
jgi:hypothetical protein